MPQLLDALGSDSEHETPTGRAMVGRLVYLTHREREIAALVAHGGSNKQIARRLAITERTVKAHLTEVFRKLGVADRLRLALLLVGTFDAPPPQGSAAETRAFAAQ
jgi:two-component system NarL family response regulator